jgi:hypothetical protein
MIRPVSMFSRGSHTGARTLLSCAVLLVLLCLSTVSAQDGRNAPRHSFLSEGQGVRNGIVPFFQMGAGAQTVDAERVRVTPAKQSRQGTYHFPCSYLFSVWD